MRRVKEIFLGFLLPMIAVLTVDILVIAKLAPLMPMKYCVMVVLFGTSLGISIGVFSDREV